MGEHQQEKLLSSMSYHVCYMHVVCRFVYGQLQYCCRLTWFITKPGCHILLISASRQGCLKRQRSVLLDGLDVQLEPS